MKSKLEILVTPDNKIALVDACETITKGCKVIHIRNFRVFDEVGVEISFNKGVNAIIGENNSGKSSIIPLTATE